MEKLLIIGTGELSLDIVDFVETYKLYDIIGFSVDKRFIKEPEYYGRPVFPFEELEKFVKKTKQKYLWQYIGTITSINIKG